MHAFIFGQRQLGHTFSGHKLNFKMNFFLCIRVTHKFTFGPFFIGKQQRKSRCEKEMIHEESEISPQLHLA